MKAPSLARRILGFIQEHCLFPRGKTVIVGVSGGPDSVCLLHLLLELREKLDIHLHVAHLNHQLRGEESEDDARYVAQLSKRRGLPVTIEAQDVATYRAQHRLSLEEAAREVRYGFFAQVVKTTGASSVAVAHTAEDQMETVLMHLLRGAGLAGLGGMKPKAIWRSAVTGDEVTVARPILEVTRRETEAYCRAHNLHPRSDTSNWFPEFWRNRIRWELLPLLKEYNPKIEAALRRTARSAAEDLAFIEDELAKVWPDAVREVGEAILLDTKVIASLPPALQRHLLRGAFHKLGRGEIAAAHIEAMVESLKRGAGRRLSLPGGLVFVTGYGTCRLGTEGPCPLPPLEGEHPIEVPGETIIPGWRVKAVILRQPVELAQGWAAHLDYDRAGSQLVVRSRKPGDRFQPLGLDQPKKLQDFMVDAKIPQGWRGRVPLVASPHQILWVVGWRIDERVKVTPATQRVLSLQFERQNPS